MKYTEKEKIAIGGQVVNHELTYSSAAQLYSVSIPSIANWVRLYKEQNNIQSDNRRSNPNQSQKDIETLKLLSKDELIDEVIKARIGEERAKKGYEVKGGGQKKEYVSLSNKNTK